MKVFSISTRFWKYLSKLSIIQVIIKKLSSSHYLINFNKLKFWNNFITISFVCLLWLSFIAFIATHILQQIVDPVQFTNNNSVIIEIYPESTEQKIQNKITLLKKILDAEPNVTNYEVLSLEKLKQMIYNFTGKEIDNINNLNLPRIIVATVANLNQTLLEELRITIAKKVSNIMVDTEHELITRITDPIQAAKYIMMIVPIVAFFVLALILFLIVSAVLFSNKETFEILVALGAPFNTIAYEFSHWIFTKTIKATIFCAILDCATLGFCTLNFSITTMSLINYIQIVLISIVAIPILSAFLTKIYVYKLINNNF